MISESSDESDRLKKGICSIPSDSEQVLDADEEVFILYSELQAQAHESPSDTTVSEPFRGLGHVDSHQDVLSVNFTLKKPEAGSTSESVPPPKRSRKAHSRSFKDTEVIELEIQIAQDKTALRTRKGDTGSVVWKASVDFASMMLQQAHFPSNSCPSLFDKSKLKDAHVLELGSGTGVLCVALSPLVRQYTATDIHDLIPLIQKNVVLNFPNSRSDSNIRLTPLDWLELQKTSPNNRLRFFKFDPVDLLLVVDCIYHPSLIPSLVETIDYLAMPDVTTVLVVVELRAEDVIREFLARWLSVSDWEIWRIGDGEERIMKRPYAMTGANNFYMIPMRTLSSAEPADKQARWRHNDTD